MRKKGEALTSFKTGRYLLLLAGFVIILSFVFVILDLQGQEESEICRFSVLTRATAPEKAQRLIPLKCTTKKICFKGRGSDGCDEFIGEKNVESVKLPNKVGDAAGKIEEVSANAMYGCWSMMGKGKLDLTGGGLLGGEEPLCVICSRIAVDIPDDEKMEYTLDEVDIGEYMEKTQVPGSSLTFLQELTDVSVNSYVRVPDAPGVGPSGKDKEFGSGTNELAIVFTQIKSKEYLDILKDLAKYGGVSAGATFFTPGVNRIAATGPGLVIGGLAAAGTVTYAMLNVYEGRVAAAGYCGQFTSTEEGIDGCSTIQILPYEFNVLNDICSGGILGNP